MADLINRQAALNAICEDGTQLERQGQYSMTMAERKQRDVDILEALPSVQPGCEDAVSRFEVLRLIDYSSHDLNDSVDNRYMQNEIKQLPSVIPKQPGWIPVTERLPEVKQRVLVQQKDGFMMVRKCIDGGHLAWFYSDIVAWMPLPEPWKGEKP